MKLPTSKLVANSLSYEFKACNASIAARATDLIGFYECDNGRKGE